MHVLSPNTHTHSIPYAQWTDCGPLTTWLSSNIHSPQMISMQIEQRTKKKKNAAAELNPKHIWSKINSPGPSSHPHRQPTLHSPYPTAHSPGPLINIHFFFFFLFMLQKKKAVMGKKGDQPRKKPSENTRTRMRTHLKIDPQFTNNQITAVTQHTGHLMENK